MTDIGGSQQQSEQEDEEEQFARLTSDHAGGASSRQSHHENQYRSAALQSQASSKQLKTGTGSALQRIPSENAYNSEQPPLQRPEAESIGTPQQQEHDYEFQQQMQEQQQQAEDEEYNDLQLNQKQNIIDHNVERLQLINLKLRNKIKELNQVVEKALERQTSKIVSKQNQQQQFDADHMLRIREKEIANSKKQIETNKNVIDKLKAKLKVVQPRGTVDAEGNPVSWETKYQLQLELRAKLEKSIKQLEKQNSAQGNAIEKATNTEDQQKQLKSLQEELRVWKQKVTTLSTQLERDRETRKEQDSKLQQLQSENDRVQQEIEQAGQTQGVSEEQLREIEERNAAEQKVQEEQEQFRMNQDGKFKEFKKKEWQQKSQIGQLNAELEALKFQLKEKEQLNRISSYKLNDLKRSIKHNQLKPLVPKTDGEGSILSGQSSQLDDGSRKAGGNRFDNNASRRQLAPLYRNSNSVQKVSSPKKGINAAPSSIENSASRKFGKNNSKTVQQPALRVIKTNSRVRAKEPSEQTVARSQSIEDDYQDDE